MKAKPMQNLYRSADVAKIIGVEEWRIKNFSQGKAYNLPPSIRLGSGKRKWRVYTFQDVLRHAIADELVRYGFGPEAVGKAIEAISDARLTSWTSEVAAAGEEGKEPDWEALPALVNTRGEWKVMNGRAFQDRFLGYGGDWRGVFVLNYPSLLGQVIKQISEYEGSK
jgi:hypothetical protein